MKQPPSIGRIVHYVIPGSRQHCPALITRVWNRDPGTVNLRVLGDHEHAKQLDKQPQNDCPTSVTYDEQQGERTWHWPEIEPAMPTGAQTTAEAASA